MTLQTHRTERSSGCREATAEDREVFRYARCIRVSKRMRWNLEEVIKGRSFDPTDSFLPDGFTKVSEFPGLSAEEKRVVSQIQGRTYANMFGVLERYVNAKVLELSKDHWFGDQTKLEALVRFSDEEIKHQHLFRTIEDLMAATMPNGYRFTPKPNAVARMVLSKSTWAVLGFTLMVEIVTQAHYRESIAKEAELSPLYKDVFHYHWMEECQHAILDELEWRREDQKLSANDREAAVDELVELALAIDRILQDQSKADTEYFLRIVNRVTAKDESEAITNGFLTAYRWQYIFSGAENAHFVKVVKELTTATQMQHFASALQTLN